MGYAKYAEDIQRDIDRNDFFRSVEVPNVSPEIYYDCYYCDKSFKMTEDRNTHIKKEHNVVGPLLIINGKMCCGTEYIENINTVAIELCGFSDIVISVNGERVDNDDLLNITDRVKKATARPILIQIGSKEYALHFYNQTNISNAEVKKIIEGWEARLENKLPIKKDYPKNLNSAEERYLNGFFNYYMACAAKDTDKKKRYEDAYAILSEFNTLMPKARVLLKVIAFRLNWVEHLEELCKMSGGAFDSVLAFFKNKQDEKVSTDNRRKEVVIFVEPDDDECLEAIMAFQEEDWAKVDSYIDLFTDEAILQIADNNFKDRLFLLKARRLKMRGEYKLARKYYEEIKSPCFRAEAETAARV